jgi:hypothetical protein
MSLLITVHLNIGGRPLAADLLFISRQWSAADGTIRPAPGFISQPVAES